MCCTISMSNEIREWHRKNIENYTEIYLEVPLDTLKARRKELYEGALSGREKNVVGINQVAEFPKHPEVQIMNDGTKTPEEIAKIIFGKLLSLGKI